MFKMGSHDPFGHLKHKLWPKEKSEIDPIYVCVGWVWHIVGKLSTRATTLLQTSSQSEVYTRSYGPPKLQESQLWQFLDSKMPFGCGPRGKAQSKGEGGGFPQVRAMVSFVSSSCSWFVLAPKVLQLCTNHLMLVLCRSVWVSEACQFLLVPSRSSSTPLYPSKVLRAKELASAPCFSIVFCLKLTFESLKELKVRQLW